ncbi:MAG TPA: Ig-like domain-containing protein [Bacteroidia bacterium]
MNLRILQTALLLLSIIGCNKNTTSFEPYVDQSDSLLPVFRFALNPGRETAFKKGDFNALVKLFLVTDNKVSQTPVGTTLILHNDTFESKPLNLLGYGLEFEWQLYYGKDTFKHRFKTPTKRIANGLVEVEQVYPLADSIPENTLLFHILFNEPMVEDPMAFKLVSIIDKSGKSMPYTWREKASWADNGKQLVLMVHPGRIKREIMYAKEYGPLFEPEKSYQLKIEEGLKTISGKAFKGYSKTYVIKSVDRTSPKIIGIKSAPKLHSTDAIIIEFNEGMDYGSLQIGMKIFDKDRKMVNGKMMAINDRLWQFTPDSAWSNQYYTVDLDDYCADLASNHLGREFEVNKVEDMKRDINLSVSFTPK